MIPDKFKIDAFLILIDISKERLEKQPIQDQLGKFYPFHGQNPNGSPQSHPNCSGPLNVIQ